jgi:hypothetical protein
MPLNTGCGSFIDGAIVPFKISIIFKVSITSEWKLNRFFHHHLIPLKRARVESFGFGTFFMRFADGFKTCPHLFFKVRERVMIFRKAEGNQRMCYAISSSDFFTGRKKPVRKPGPPALPILFLPRWDIPHFRSIPRSFLSSFKKRTVSTSKRFLIFTHSVV